MRSSACLLALALTVCVASSRATDAASAPTREQVRHEAVALRDDPNLPGTRKEKTLRIKERQTDKPADGAKPFSLPRWLTEFSRWISTVGRVFVWTVAAVLVALLLVGLRHWVRARAGAAPVGKAHLPSHVRDLDIRPESLPERIGPAARTLWERGEHRAALSLLYRGALSRLVHDHAVPIRAASTEGECLALAAQRMPAARSAFFGRLVSAWQLAVYGARLPESDAVLALCAEFDQQLVRASA